MQDLMSTGTGLAALLTAGFFALFGAVIFVAGLFPKAFRRPDGIWPLFGLQAVLTVLLLIPAALGTWLAAIVYGLAGMRCQYEVMTVLRRDGAELTAKFLSVLSMALAFTLILALPPFRPAVWVLGASLILLAALVLFRRGYGLEQGVSVLTGSLLPVILTCHLIDLFALQSGGFASLFVLFAIVELQDSMGYVAGKLFGRRLLWPSVSPKKTVEGAVAGLAVALATGIPLAHEFLGMEWQTAVLVACVTALSGFAGDLAASHLKRRVGVKDFPPVHPVAGGVFDMFDSLLIAAVPYKFLLLALL